MFIQLEDIFTQLCFFLYDHPYSADFPIFENEEDPLPMRQQILKEMNLIEIFTDIVYFPFASGLYRLTKIDDTEMVTSMLGKCYATLRFTIQEFRPNEIYCS